MISAEQFLDLLDEKDLLPPKLLESLRRQLAEAKTPETKARLTAALVAKRLVDSGHLSRRLAQRLLDQGAGAPPAQRPATDRPKPQPPSPGSKDLTIAEDELAPLDEELAPLEDDLPPLEEVGSAADAELAPLDELIPLDEPSQSEMTLADISDNDDDASDEYGLAPAPLPPARPQTPPLPSRAGTNSVTDDAMDFLDQMVPLPGDDQPSSAGDFLSATAGEPLAAAAGKKDFFGRGRRVRGKGNVWDSPLLLIGGGVLLLLLILGGVLLWAISRESAEEMLRIADESYSAGSYTRAIQEYNRFLEKAPEDPGASKARIRRGLAQMRQVTDSSSDWSRALEVSKSVLGEIASETDFRGEAQPELAAMLPKIAEGLAKQAHEKTNASLVEQARETLALVEKYVAKSSRPHTRLADVEALLALSNRDIGRGAKLAETIVAMKAAAAAGKTEQAYLLRSTLLREYPNLADNEELREAVLAVSQAEQEAVKLVAEQQAPLTEGPALPYRKATALVRRETTADVPGAAGRAVFAVAGGAVYGLDAATGKVQWRRPAGFAANGRSPSFPPTLLGDAAGADVLLVDASRNELVALEGPTGTLRWRFPLKEPFDAHPVIAGDRILVATRSGRLVILAQSSGESPGYVRFPQQLRCGPAVDAGGSTAFQVAEHSNLFVLSLPDGRCKQVLYLGHEPGTITVSPVVIDSLLVVARNEIAEKSTLSVYSIVADGEKSGLVRLQQLPLKGHINTPLVVSGRRLLVVTDKAELAVFEVRGAEPDKPLGKVADAVASGDENLVRFPLLLGDQFYLGDAALTKYDVLASRERLQPRWTENQQSVTLQPLAAVGSTAIHVRRKIGLPGVFVSAVDADGKTLWQTQLAAGLAAEPLLSAGSDQLTLTTALGAIYESSFAASEAGSAVVEPMAAIAIAELPKPIASAVRLDDGSMALGTGRGAEEIVVINARDKPVRIRRFPLPDPLGGGLAAFSGGILAPSEIGQVYLVDPRNGEKRAEPFQPTVESGAKYAWHHAPGSEPGVILLSHGGGLFRVGVQDAPKRHLAALAVAAPASPLGSAPAVAEKTVYAADAADNLVAFSLPELKPSGSWPLEGPCVWGPRQAGKYVLAATEDQLIGADAEQPRWKTPLPFGRPVGVPLVDADNALLASATGTIWRVELASGKKLGQVELGIALANGPVRLGERLLVFGEDGTAYEFEKPPVTDQPQ
ncbi:MAG: PQQ-binding-like beta-propeller repeat protein [Rhodopirellula sp.]|nr:PQQ-binding-like beta-propeller repeat protein [Rhodopirellula sp.]